MNHKFSRVRVVVAAVVATALLAASCGDDGAGEASGSTTTTASQTTAAVATTAAPKVGGTLTVGTFSQTAGLDPVVTTGGGNSGSSEVGTIHDTIMRYDNATGKYEPQTAESLSPNADFSEWTLKLRSGIKFTDGTDYDAQAVVDGIKRHLTFRSSSAGLVANIKDFQVVDKLTAKFVLTSAWAGFPYLLSFHTGMIPSPTATKACDATKAARECAYNVKPVGAGPFMIDGEFKSGEPIVVKRNPNYWGGQAYLDSIRFVNIPGAQATLDALKNGTVNVAVFRDAIATKKVTEDKTLTTVFNWKQYGGNSLVFFTGKARCAGGSPKPACDGKADGTIADIGGTPTLMNDKRLREAVVAALDPSVINTRAFEGSADATTEIIQKDSRLYTNAAGPKVDLNRAKQLVEEVKKEGKWDGTIKLGLAKNPANEAIGLAAKTMLEQAGFKVTMDITLDVQGYVGKVITKTSGYDILGWAVQVEDADPFIGVQKVFDSKSALNVGGFISDALDAQVKAMKEAKDDAARKNVLAEVQKLVNQEFNVATYASVVETVATQPKVQGLKPSVNTYVLYDKAWIS